jgi:hypothetical protein
MKIMDEFSHIYDVRSQIVHRGKSRISANERELFGTLRWYSKRVIAAELKMLPDAPGYKVAEPSPEVTDQPALA